MVFRLSDYLKKRIALKEMRGYEILLVLKLTMCSLSNNEE
jgi:hypothetical protein